MRQWQLEPARDLGLSPRARLASLAREAGLVAASTHLVWWAATHAYLAAFHRFRVTGRENVPDEPPYLLVANHTSHLDAVALGACVPARHCNRSSPIAAGDTFFDALPTSIFAALAMNALPLWRRKPRPGELASLRERLIERRSIFMLFPEGTRARDGRMAAFKPGVGRLVAGTAVPILPCHIGGAFAALPPHRRTPRPLPVCVAIGRPLTFDQTRDDKEGWTEIAAALEAAVRGLAARENGGAAA